MERFGRRPLTLADYASTSGVSLALDDDDVWVNAPIAAYNPNFVFDPRHELAVNGDRLFLKNIDTGRELAVRFAPVPAYYDHRNGHGEPYTAFVHTHTDRARLSPVRGCAMRCQFCDIPYEFKGKYFPKPFVKLLEAAARAIDDPIQPASHLLISGGTPGKRDYTYLKQAYRGLISAFEGIAVDVMMVPMRELIDLNELEAAGVNELSLNIEIWDRDRARRFMPEKYELGLTPQLDFIAEAVDQLGQGRVRSMLMVGLEEAETTLAAVAELAKIGCVPVLSPFRPDPITDLASMPPPSAEEMARIFLEAREIAGKYGVKLGPRCVPCSHNTLTLADGSADYVYNAHRPTLI